MAARVDVRLYQVGDSRRPVDFFRFFIAAVKLAADGVLRGAGLMWCFMAATFTDLILRVVLAFVLSEPFGSTGIWAAWPIGWCIATALSVTFYIRGFVRKSHDSP